MTRVLPIEPVRTSLLAWYRENKRDLPWRTHGDDGPDPYRVWLSEVMLQQTRVDTVKPYFVRWVERFPSLQALAAAEGDEVLKAWEGLGYYSRARNFHRAVREVVERYAGQVPADRERLLTLPGIGRYTAGAIASIAFGLPEPIVDGNVRRVFARLEDEPAPDDGKLWQLAATFADHETPGEVNQALMELGALICTPARPDCGACPISHWCLSFDRGTQAARPAARKRSKVRDEAHGVAVIRRDSRFLVVRRPETGLLGGMWEFPGGVVEAGETAAMAARRIGRDRIGALVIERSLGAVRHIFSHLAIEYRAFLARPADGKIPMDSDDGSAWATAEELGEYALPVAQRKILSLALEA